MHIGVLGPFEVVVDGVPLRLGGPQPRAVLAVLALRANEVVATDVLVETVWPDDPPRSAVQIVRTYVSRLRRELSAGGATEVRLTSRAPGYVLEVDADRVDAARFEGLVHRARAAADAGETGDAAATFQRALDLWRGDVLADLGGPGTVRAAAGHLDQMRLAALEERIDADLTLGRHGAISAELAALTRTHPFRERLWGQLMVALYRTGRQTEALAAYQALRSSLVEQFGIEPGPDLQDLERRVLSQDPDLSPPPTPASGPGLADRQPLPLPAALTHPAHDRPLVGRERERAMLAEALETARAGHFSAVFVGGPPGIGKTALAAQFARRARTEGAAVVLGRADEGSAVPFQPFGEAIRHWVAHRAGGNGNDHSSERAETFVHLGPDDLAHLAKIVPDLWPGDRTRPDGRPGQGIGDSTERVQLFESVVRWVEELAAGSTAPGSPAPAVVLLDDLQWADPASLLAVRHLLRHPPAAGALLLATHRDVEIGEGHPLLDLLAGAHSDAHVRRIRLGELGEADVADLLAGHAGHDLDHLGRAFAAQLTRLTGGNPLFVHETVRYLTERGVIAPGDGRWTTDVSFATLGVPGGVREVIEQRLWRLPAEAASALRHASVLGEHFRLPLLGRMMELPPDEVVAAVEPALAAGLLKRGDVQAGGLAFSHALVRETQLDGLTLGEQARLHWRAGRALAALDAGAPEPRLGEIAHHLSAGIDAGDPLVAVDANVRAGQQALSALAFEDAATRFEAAVALLDAGHGVDAELAFEAAFGLGQTGGALSDCARQRAGFLRAASVARAERRPDRLAHAAMGFVDYVNAAGQMPRPGWAGPGDQQLADELMDEALAAVGDAASPARCLLLTHKTVRAVPLAQSAAARAAADAAVDTARLLDDPAAVPFALVARMWSLLGSPVRPELRDAPADALAFTAPPELGVSLRVFVVPMLPMVPLHMGERAEVDAVRDTVAADPHTRGSKHLAAYVQMWDGALALAAGRLDVAEHLATTILAAGDSSVWADVSALQTIVVGMERGDPTVGFRLEAYLSVVQRSDVAQSLLTSLAAAAGDQALAYRHIDVLRRATPDDLGWCAPLTYRHLAEAAAHLGDRELAAELLPETSRYAGQLLVSFAATTLDAAADRAIGQNLMVLGRLDEAVERLRSARAFEQAFGADALAARSGYWLARALLERRGPGDGDAARRLLHEAAAEAQKLGMEGLHRDLQVVLAAGG